LEKPHRGGLVEAIELLELTDELGIQPARPAILAQDRRLPASLSGPTRCLGAAPAQARRGLDGCPPDARRDPLDGPARRHLHDDEVDHHDPEQSREDQEKSANDVGQHVRATGALEKLGGGCAPLPNLPKPVAPAKPALGAEHQSLIADLERLARGTPTNSCLIERGLGGPSEAPPGPVALAAPALERETSGCRWFASPARLFFDGPLVLV